MDGYRHFIRTDTNGIVVKGFTDAFEQPQTGDLKLTGYDGRHFTLQLTNERGQFIYKVENGSMVARSQAELDVEWNSRPPAEPSVEERLAAAEAALLSIMGL
jgi:hypothetical protein